MKKHILVSIITLLQLLLGLTGAAQTPQPNFTIATPQTGNKTYIARDYVSLKPGFTAKPGIGETFTAKIDQCYLFPPTNSTYLLPDGSTTSNSTLGGAVVGAIPGQLEVSPTGAATYAIPIEVPAGINGMQPNISLVYNSQGGTNVLGQGFSLGGITSISRVPKTKLYNSRIDGISYDYTCQFALDGNPLVTDNGPTPINSDNINYSTKLETFVKVTSHGTKMVYINGIGLNTGPNWFDVLTKDGSTIEYGNSSNSKSIPKGGNFQAVGNWLINKSTDNNGNYTTYVYNNSNNEINLQQINYTGNGSVNPFCSIYFEYVTASKQIPIIICGRTIYNRKLLKNIIIKQGLTTLRTYTFTYDTNLKSHDILTKVDVKSGNGDKLPSNSLGWGAIDPNIIKNTFNIPNADGYDTKATDKNWASLNVNNDGIDDLIAWFNWKRNDGGGHYTYLKVIQLFTSKRNADGSVTFANTKNHENGGLVDLDWEGIVSKTGGFSSLFYNGNNTPDIIMPFLNKTDYWCQIAFGDFTNDKLFAYDLKSSTNDLPPYSFADLNNDGLGDILYIENKKYNGTYPVGILFGKSEYPTATVPVKYDLSFNLSDAPKRLIPNDFDNDGLVDLMVITDSGFSVLKNLGSTPDANGVYCPQFKGTETLIPQNTLFNAKYSALEMGDFNGDGILDIIGNEHCNSKWYFFIGDGTGSFTKKALSNVTAIEEDFTSKNDNKDDCIVMDLNNDGLSDVIILDAQYEKHDPWIGSTWGEFLRFKVSIYYANNDQLTLQKSYTVNDEGYCFNKTNLTGDFNGDGITDLINFGCDILSDSTKPVKDNLFHLYRFNNPNFNQGQLISISDGNGVETTINYQPLSIGKKNDGSDFYTKDTYTCDYPLRSYTMPINCVSEITTSLQNVVIQKQKYSYGDAIFQATGKGFLGFHKTTTTDAIAELTSTSTTTWDNSFFSPLNILQETKTTSGAKISTQEQRFKTFKSNNNIITYPDWNKTTNHLKSNSISLITYNYGTDLNGNPKTITSDFGSGITEIKTIQYSQYGSWAWCPNRPQRITTALSNSDGTSTRIKTFDYNSKAILIQEIQDPGDANQVTTNYKNINAFGYPTETEVIANGKTLSSSVTFTPSGRFVSSKTDALGKTTSFVYDETKGLLLSETNELGTSNYVYDGFGRAVKSTSPDKIQTVSALQWAGAVGPAGAKYYSYSETSGNSPVTTWYDGLNREILTESYGLNGNKVLVATEYNNKGQIWRISEPYFEDDAVTYATTNTYDNYGRITKVVTPMGSVDYDFPGLTTKVTTPDGITETTLNAAGQTVLAKTNGKGVAYTYYPSGLTHTTTPEGGPGITMEYDLQGNRTKITDPSAGVITNTYNGFGQMLTQTQLVDINSTTPVTTTNNYLPDGRLNNVNLNGEVTHYNYDGLKRLVSTEIAGKNKQTYTYDAFYRVTQMVESVGADKSFTSQTTYDAFGRVQKEVMPSGYYTKNNYDKYGYLTSVTDKTGLTIWEAIESNARGQLTSMKQGGRVLINSFDQRGLSTGIYSSGIIDMAYLFNAKGNLDERTDGITNQSEKFTYDALNRLTNWDVYKNNTLQKANSVNYDAAYGNIESKSDIGYTMKYGENSQPPYALTSIQGNPALIADDTQTITYTPFKKVATISEGTKGLQITYGTDQQRCKSIFTNNQVTTLTRYYAGNYEEEVAPNGNIRKLHYISGGNGLAAIYVQNGGKDSIYYCYTDNQSNLLAVTNQAGTVLDRLAYDPWGVRRNPGNWTTNDIRASFLFARGYTLHEHLDAFSLINMNGRMYDPLVARFLSPDPYIQSPGNWINYNRYGYCINNPLIYTDPSGEVFGIDDLIIIGAMAYFGGMQANFFHAAETGKNPFNPGNWNWKSPSTYIGLASGALTGAGQAGFNVPTLFPKIDGMLTRGAFQAGVNVGVNGIANTIIGDPFLKNVGGAALSGFINGAITGYQLADVNSKNLWWGSDIGYNRNKWSLFNWAVPDYTIDFRISNAGSKLANDCVPTSFAEIETKRGGSRTYDNFKNSSNYQEDVGVSISRTNYEKLIHRTFSNTQTISNKDYHKLFDANYMRNAAANNEVFSVHFSGHADNIRSLKVFTGLPSKNTLTFRQSSYNFNRSGKGVSVMNIFRIF